MADQTGFRARVAPAPGSPDPAPIVVRRLAEAAEPLSNPTEGEPGWQVDGAPVHARLEARGSKRAVLHGSDGPVQVLFLPAGEASGPAGSAGPSGPSGPDGRVLEVVLDGWRLLVTVELAARAAIRDLARRGTAGPGTVAATEVRAIIPGRVASVEVSAGAAVELGQALLVVEAMKMQNEVRAPRAGTVRLVAVTAGQTVEAGALLIVIE